MKGFLRGALGRGQRCVDVTADLNGRSNSVSCNARALACSAALNAAAAKPAGPCFVGRIRT